MNFMNLLDNNSTTHSNFKIKSNYRVKAWNKHSFMRKYGQNFEIKRSRWLKSILSTKYSSSFYTRWKHFKSIYWIVYNNKIHWMACWLITYCTKKKDILKSYSNWIKPLNKIYNKYLRLVFVPSPSYKYPYFHSSNA